MTMDQAITTIADHESKINEVLASADLEISDDDALVIQGSRFRLDGAGFRRFCEQVSAPAAYMQDLPERVRQPVLQHHLNCCNASPVRLVVFVRDGQFLAFGRGDLARLRGREVLEAVQEGANCELNVHDVRIEDEAFQADLLVENATEEVAVGDIVRAGLRVTHSMTGDHATWVEAFVYRLVCENGMTHRDCVDRRAARTRRMSADHPDARKLQIEQVQRLAAKTTQSLRQKLGAIRTLRNENIDVNKTMSRFLERGGMSTRLWLPVLREAWEAEGNESTAFGVMNALTRVATHRKDLSARHRRILGGLAGILAFREIHICPRCFSQIRGPAGGAPADLN